jgi:adenylyltransferase/sulfurtransferase
VFGVLPGIIGSMMAFETIKYLLNIGRPMIGRYLLFEGEDMSFRELKLRQSKTCPLCGENPTVVSLIDYEAWCGTAAMETSQAQAS